MAPIQAEGIFQIVQSLPRGLVAVVLYPACRLQQRRRAEKAFAIPPVARAGSRATSAKDAFIKPVELFSLIVTLPPFLFRRRCLGLEPRFDQRKLGVKVGEIWNQIFDHR